jgi:hypothetical protein
MLGFAPSNLQATSGMNAMGGTVPVPYDLNDEFITADDAPVASPRTCEPGPGALTLVETDGTWAVSGGNLDFTAQSTPAWGDQGFYGDAVARVAGRMFMTVLNPSATNKEMWFGWSVNQRVTSDFPADGAAMAGFHSTSTPLRLRNDDKYITLSTVNYSTSTDYNVAIILRSAGSFIYMKGGAYTDWSLLYVEDTDSTATLYPVVSVKNHSGSFDDFRIPSLPYIPTPLAYDTFTRDDSDSLGSTETTGPDGQGCVARAWTESNGDWDIISNKAQNVGSAPGGASWVLSTDVTDSDMFVECVQQSTSASGDMGIVWRYTDNDNLWAALGSVASNTWILYERTTGTWNNRTSGTPTLSATTDYNLKASVAGNVHNVWLDDANHLTYTSVSHITATKAGIRSGLANNKVDSFTSWPINPQDFPKV